MAKKVPKQNDIIVGGNVRRMRLRIGVSQEKLADGLGLTFQQVQKYEKGTNRIGASRLIEIATVLRCEVGDLFSDTITRPKDGKRPPPDPMRELSSTPLGVELAQLFPLLTKGEQHKVVSLIEGIVDERR